eukprot:sb/3479418/
MTCCLPKIHYDIKFLRFCKKSTLQFCAVKPIVSIITIILEANNQFHENNLRPKYGYLYVTIIYNISVTLALYALVLFYLATREILKPHDPVLKFFMVKAIIFASFWQGGPSLTKRSARDNMRLRETAQEDRRKRGYHTQTQSLSVSYVPLQPLELIDVIKDTTSGPDTATRVITTGEISASWQNFLICVEMLISAFLLRIAFPERVYDKDGGSRQKLSSNIRDTLNPKYMITDYIHNFSSTYSSYALGNQSANDESDVESRTGGGGSSAIRAARTPDSDHGDQRGWQGASSSRQILVENDELGNRD